MTKSKIKAFLSLLIHVIWSTGSLTLIILGLLNQIWPMAGGGALLLAFYIFYNKLWRKVFIRKKKK